MTTTPRRIKFSGPEHQYREIHALHFRRHGDGPIHDWGDGTVVMRVVKTANPFVDVLGETGWNEFDEPFRYADYFLLDDSLTLFARALLARIRG